MDLGTGLIPAFEKGDLDLVVAGKDLYQGIRNDSKLS